MEPQDPWRPVDCEDCAGEGAFYDECPDCLGSGAPSPDDAFGDDCCAGCFGDGTVFVGDCLKCDGDGFWLEPARTTNPKGTQS